MALSFLGGAGNTSSAKFFDIRLDDEYIVFRGNEEEAASAHLRGKLVLCLAEPLAAKYIRLTLTGVSKVGHNTQKTTKKSKERIFYQKEWAFEDAGKGKTTTLKPDNYEYPFDLVLPGSLSESVEGLPDSFVIYRFKAEIGRRCAKDIVIRKPLRIIRTLDFSTLELAHAMTVANVWPNKIEYSISTPSKAIIYGTSIQVEFRLVSLLKGLKIGTISSQLLETHEVSSNPDAVSLLLNSHKTTRVVAEDSYTVPEDPEVLNEEAEGYQFSRHIELPKSLTQCMQDAETRGIKIRHKLKFNVLLHNPDDHTSELRATLPVSLYISPSLAINENNELVDQTPVAARRALENDMAHQAPPLYADHQLDQMYSEVDYGGFRTPGTFSTPGTPYRTDSRNISSDDISSTDPTGAGVPGLFTNSTRTGDVSASALRSRLQNLRLGTARPEDPQHNRDISPDASRRGSAINGDHQSDYFSSRNSSRNSRSRSRPNRSRSMTPGQERSSSGSGATLSRRTSDENYDQLPSGAQTPGSQILEWEHLSRVPSYSTAVRIPAYMSYSGPDLPSYGVATSRNASVSSSPGGGSEILPTAHLRGRIAGRGNSWTSEPSFDAGDLDLPERTEPAGSSRSRIVAEIQDEERRLRLMQVRGRA